MSCSALIIYYPENFSVFFTREKFGGFDKQMGGYMGIITKNYYEVVMKIGDCKNLLMSVKEKACDPNGPWALLFLIFTYLLYSPNTYR